MPTPQSLAGFLADKFGISTDFRSASNHPYSCTCSGCRNWWLQMGPDPDNSPERAFGPFHDSLWPAYAAKYGCTVYLVKKRFSISNGLQHPYCPSPRAGSFRKRQGKKSHYAESACGTRFERRYDVDPSDRYEGATSEDIPF